MSFLRHRMLRGAIFTSGSGGCFSLSTYSYDEKSIAIITQDTVPTGLAFSPDGTKMFLSGNENDAIFQYTLTTGFDLSTASYDSVSFSVAGQTTSPQAVEISPDGSKLFVLGSGRVFQYALSTAFDISTASYGGINFNAGTQDGLPTGFRFSADGTKMFTAGLFSASVYQYSLSEAFEVDTASYDSVSFSVSGQETTVQDLAFCSAGKKMYVIFSEDAVFQYALTAGFDLSTASYDNDSFSTLPLESSPTSVVFSDDDSKMFIVGASSDIVYQYSSSA